MSPDVLSKFQKNICEYIEPVMKNGRFGICSGVLRLLEPKSGSALEPSESNYDRFKFSVPYAGLTVHWEVVFNADSPSASPDFIFGLEDADFVPDIDNIKSLADWTGEDPKSLLYVLQELFQEYKRHHEVVVDKYSRLQFEYRSLIDSAGYTSKEIEIHILQKSQHKVGPINFLVSLHVNFAKIPAYLTKENPGEDSAVLLVTFSSPDGGKVSPQLFLSPRVERALGGAAALRIPPFPTDDCMMDYVPHICELLKNKVDQVVAGYDARKEYISAFLGAFRQSVIEYDCESFQEISFLYCWNDFYFIITIELSQHHPNEKPGFVFQSVYHEDGNRTPYQKRVVDYPYSPRWKGIEMAERARTFILERIPEFQKGSVTEGSYQ